MARSAVRKARRKPIRPRARLVQTSAPIDERTQGHAGAFDTAGRVGQVAFRLVRRGDGIAKAFSTAIVGTGEKSDQVLTDRDSGGVEFLGENGGGPGVRLKPPKAKGKRSVPG
jgi:hypothetical protein